MPPEHRLGLDEEPVWLASGEQSPQPGEQSPIDWSQSRAGHLATQHRHLVAEHDDLDRQVGLITPAQAEQLEDAYEREIEE
jgi:hypothetical protein